MNYIIILSITIIAIVALYFNYKKEKTKDLNAKKKFARCFLIVSAISVALNFVNFLYNEGKYATKEDFKLLEAKYADLNLKSRLSEPTQKEVESEIDKQFKAEFAKKKKIALEEYQKGVSFYQRSNFDKAIEHFETAIKIFAIPTFYLARGNSYYLTN